MKKTVYYILLSCLLSACHTTPTLKGKKIVVTAPEIYAIRLKKALEKQEAQVILMPTIETIVYDSLPRLAPLSDSIRAQSQTSNKFDFIVLPSRNAIKAFDNEINRSGNKKDWITAHFYVLGKDQEFLKSLGYKSTIALEEPSMKGILSFIKKNENYHQKEMLLIAPKISLIKEPNVVPDFIKEAESMHIHCHLIYGYTTRPVINNKNKDVLINLQKGKYDLIALTSGGESYALAQLLKDKKIACKIACFGPYTASNATNAGFSVDMISDKFSSFDDYANSIVNYFNP